MPIDGEYVPSSSQWVADQVAEYEASNGERASTLRETGIPVIVVTMRGKSSGSVRKIALMRVEHDGDYALVASIGGAPDNPAWYHNIVADTHVMIQDGPEPHDFTAREIDGDEYDTWWERAVNVFPTYADYKLKTERRIPVLVAERRA